MKGKEVNYVALNNWDFRLPWTLVIVAVSWLRSDKPLFLVEFRSLLISCTVRILFCPVCVLPSSFVYNVDSVKLVTSGLVEAEIDKDLDDELCVWDEGGRLIPRLDEVAPSIGSSSTLSPGLPGRDKSTVSQILKPLLIKF